MNRMTQLIVGPGALGRLLAMRLMGHASVTLLGRRMPPTTLTLISPEGDVQTHRIHTVTATSLSSPFHGVVHLTTKAHAAESALASIASRLAEDTPLVLWQNGYGIQETLTAAWTGPVLCATTTEGAYVDDDVTSVPSEGLSSVVHAGHGQTLLGYLYGGDEALAIGIATLLDAAGLPTQAVTDIRVRLWQKLVVNAAINPLVARYRIRNGQLRDLPFRPMVEAVIDEIVGIVDAEGIPMPEKGWHARVWHVIEGTAGNRASMLQDVLAGRPTERDAIIGPLLDAAMRHNIATPRLTDLYVFCDPHAGHIKPGDPPAVT